MFNIEKTSEFDKWLRKLRDRKAKALILVRIQRIQESGNFGDCESVGSGVSELRIHYGKGYRIYFNEVNGNLILLLIGGDKSGQQNDIKKAKLILAKYKRDRK